MTFGGSAFGDWILTAPQPPAPAILKAIAKSSVTIPFAT
jgi:hypothetical protein